MARMTLPRLPNFGLDDVTNYLFPKEDFYKGLNKSALQKEGFKPGLLSEDQRNYGATDVYVMKRIWDKIAHKIQDQFVYKLDALNLGYTVRWQQTGLRVNEPERLKAENEYKQKLIDITEQLPEVNVNSYQQVRALLAWADGHYEGPWDNARITAHHKVNEIIKESDADYLLLRISEGCEYSRGIIDKRGIIKTLGFLDTYHAYKVYSHYNPYGTRTGRWSARGYKNIKAKDRAAANLQQLPRKLKHVFGFSEEEDMIFVGADLPTAELRLAAAIYVDEAMIHAFKNDIDIHKLTASRTIGCSTDEVTGDQRKKAKAENFGLLYGMKANTFQQYAFSNYDLVLTIDEAEGRRAGWMRSYPGIANTIARVTKEFWDCKKKGSPLMVSTPLGRWVKPDLYTDALNIPVQGAVAELAKLWIHYLHKMHGDIVPIVNFVHDSITVECKTSETEYWSKLLTESCAKAWSEYCKLPMMKIKDIPMPIEVGISKHYGGAS